MGKAKENNVAIEKKREEDEMANPTVPLYLDIDELLHMVGDYHLFQKLILLIFFLSTIPTFYQLLLMVFTTVSPQWRCQPNSTVCASPITTSYSPKNTSRCTMNRTDWQYTHPKDFSLVTEFDLVCEREFLVEVITSAVFFGFMFGAVILGPCADRFGRKRVLYISLTVVLLVSSLSVFTGNVYAFIASRFLVGFFLHGTFPQMVVMSSELVGDKHRAFCISVITTITAGLCMPLLALQASLIPQWKVLALVCTVPYIVLLPCAKFVPESVRYLRVNGAIEEAMEVFRRISCWNKMHLPSNVRVAPVNQQDIPIDNNNKESQDNSNTKSSEPIKRSRTAGPMDLFRTVKLATTTLVIGVTSLTISLTNFSLVLEAGNMTGHMYRDFAILNAARLPAGILIPYILNCIGRRKAVMGSGLIGGISVLVIGLLAKSNTYKTIPLICGIIGVMSMECSGIAYRTWALELFPTDIRGAGMGFSQFSNKVGATSSAWVVTDLSKLYPGAANFFIGGMGVLAFMLQSLLRETKGVKTADTGRELEEICNEGGAHDGVKEQVNAYVNPLAEYKGGEGQVTISTPNKE